MFWPCFSPEVPGPVPGVPESEEPGSQESRRKIVVWQHSRRTIQRLQSGRRELTLYVTLSIPDVKNESLNVTEKGISFKGHEW